MDLREVTEKQKDLYNKTVTHIVQSWEWGEFRKKLGTKLIRYGLYQNGKLKTAFHLSFHKIPYTKYFVGYLAKGPFPDSDLKKALEQIGKEQNCALIKVEPNVILNSSSVIASGAKQSSTDNNQIATSSFDKLRTPRNDNIVSISNQFKISPKPHFTKYSYEIDLTKPEEELLKNMHPKFRYNIKVAKKHGVKIEERTDNAGFKIYLKLYFETCKRQNYFGHDENYHRQIWEILKKENLARVLIAFYRLPNSNIQYPLNAWMLVNFHETLYYPYGGSSAEYKNLMATNLTCWEAIKLGKKMGLKHFDLWGAANPNAPDSDSYKGFTRFKASTGARLVEYLDTYDLVFNHLVFSLFTFVDKMLPLKVLLLKLIKK